MINSNKILAIIPARIGSKRLKNKNILLFNNKPLIYWTIESAKKSKHIDKILISTNSKKISNIVKKFGINIPYLRPQYLSGDNALISDLISYVLKREKNKFKYIIVLQPTSPLRSYKEIDKALKLIYLKNYDSLISINKDKKINKFGININHKSEIIEIQNNQNYNKKFNYKLNGSIYIFKKEFFDKYKKLYSLKSLVMITKKNTSIDIDTLDDFNKAEKIINNV